MIEDVLDKFDLTGLIKGPLGYGLHTGKYNDNTTLPEDHMWHGTKFGEGQALLIRDALEQIREIVTDDGRTLAQAALGWIWGDSEYLIPIPGFKNPRQVKENAGAMEFGPLHPNQIREVKRIANEVGEKLVS
jgi:aryl-alcohol dehydrogenase-like predicted oxidoreductase